MLMKPTWMLVGALAAVTLSAAMTTKAASQDRTTKIKAAFVFAFLKYTEWPQREGRDTNAPIVFAVVGQNGMETPLRAMLEGKTAAGRPIRVRTYRDVASLIAEPLPGDALYIDGTARSEWDVIRKALANQPVLTISDMPGFCEGGGMLNLFEKENRVRFEANPAAVKARGLKLSAEVLNLAAIVNLEAAP
jgi:hypothetical protein